MPWPSRPERYRRIFQLPSEYQKAPNPHTHVVTRPGYFGLTSPSRRMLACMVPLDTDCDDAYLERIRQWTLGRLQLVLGLRQGGLT